MKIGILTHHTVVNYGAFLQAYALQEAIKRLRPDARVEIINFINPKHAVINLAGWYLNSKNIKNYRHWNDVAYLPFKLYRERHKYMNMSSVCWTADDINKMGYDTIVVGSDEVWNYNDSHGYHPIKFGVGLNCNNLISYAPGACNINLDAIPDNIKVGLSRFTHVSARDASAFRLAEICCKEAPVRVLDPTFLFPLPDIDYKKKPKTGYILIYYFNSISAQTKRKLFSYAKANNLEIIGAGESDPQYSRSTVSMSPFEWIDLFKNAECVFTGTFHGVVFSLLNNKPFWVCPNNAGRISKISSLLEDFGIQDRLIAGDEIDFNSLEPKMDYASINNKIDELRKISIDYLNSSLQ